MKRAVRESLGASCALKPMLAKLVAEIPPGLYYEPKWDGFRAIVVRDGDSVEILSRNGKPMARYFPDLVAAFRAQLPPRCTVDGEIVVIGDGRLNFFALQQRVHPAASRVDRLAGETPASFIAFDLLDAPDEAVPGAAGRAREALRWWRRRCTSRRSRATRAWRATGSSASRAPGSTA